MQATVRMASTLPARRRRTFIWHHHATRDMEARTVSKHALLKEMGALLLFVIVAGMAAMPCLCVTGAMAGRYKMALFLLVSLRLAWSIYRRTFRFRDYWIYFAIVMTFCIWTDFNY